ncbi:MAG: thiamine pyrophosphate-dependent dehydrogenase E1 component subunit alpha [Solirubrobacterales bacterium]
MDLIDRYRAMVLMRRFEDVCAAGAESGEIHGELHLASGQEGVAAGMIGQLRDDDALVSTHRSHQHAIAKGTPLVPLLAEIFERGTGLCGGFGGHMHLFDPEHKFSCTGIVGASLPVAVGHAYAATLADEGDSVAVAVTGDGGTSTGAFHESLNLAAAWGLPLVVLVENNRYAISVPAATAVSGPGIAARATAYGALGLEVDGTDVEAMAETFAEAVGVARRREAVVLLEAHCERFRGHYEGDLDHYRSRLEKEDMRARDPLRIARDRLLERGRGEAELESLEQEARAQVDAALEQVRAAPAPDPAHAREHVFAPTGPADA